MSIKLLFLLKNGSCQETKAGRKAEIEKLKKHCIESKKLQAFQISVKEKLERRRNHYANVTPKTPYK